MLICAASNNAGKLKELRRILERMGHEVKKPATPTLARSCSTN